MSETYFVVGDDGAGHCLCAARYGVEDGDVIG